MHIRRTNSNRVIYSYYVLVVRSRLGDNIFGSSADGIWNDLYIYTRHAESLAVKQKLDIIVDWGRH